MENKYLTNKIGFAPGVQSLTDFWAVLLNIDDFPDPPAPYITNGLLESPVM